MSEKHLREAIIHGLAYLNLSYKIKDREITDEEVTEEKKNINENNATLDTDIRKTQKRFDVLFDVYEIDRKAFTDLRTRKVIAVNDTYQSFINKFIADDFSKKEFEEIRKGNHNLSTSYNDFITHIIQKNVKEKEYHKLANEYKNFLEEKRKALELELEKLIKQQNRTSNFAAGTVGIPFFKNKEDKKMKEGIQEAKDNIRTLDKEYKEHLENSKEIKKILNKDLVTKD